MKGMRDLKKIRSKVEKHTSSDPHKHSMTLWAGYKQTAAHGTVGDQLSSERARAIQENRDIISGQFVKFAVLCARQDIRLRGHRELEGSTNKGNFLEIVVM